MILVFVFAFLLLGSNAGKKTFIVSSKSDYFIKTFCFCVFIAAFGCSDGEFSSHPSDCNKYLICNHGQQVEMSCPSGLNWNNSGRYCDWPESTRKNSFYSVLAGQFRQPVVMAKCHWLKWRNRWVASGLVVIVWLKIAPPPNTLTPSYH